MGSLSSTSQTLLISVLVLPVQSQKSHKIDLSQDYPCPCRRRGRITPIALTEAFGCNRCQQIFVVEDSGQVLEQLSGTYPYKKAWRWNGRQWRTANSYIGDNYLSIALGIVVVIMVVGMTLLLSGGSKSNPPQLVLIVGVLLLALLPALMVLLAYRR
jgi:hypothetical protein